MPCNLRPRIMRIVSVTCVAGFILGMTLLYVGSSALAIHNSSTSVARTVTEFHSFVQDVNDTHSNADSLVEGFLTREPANPSQSIAAAIDGNLVEVAHTPRSLAAEDELLHTMLSSPTASGVFDDPDHGPTPWARVTVDGADSSTATLLVAQFTDEAMGFARQYVQLTGAIGAIVVIVVVLATWGMTGMFIARTRTEIETVAFEASTADTVSSASTAATALRSLR